MFKIPEFPSIDFSGLDVNALRQSAFAQRIAAIELPKIDTEKLAAVVRDAAYLTVGIGVTAVERAQAGHLVGQARDLSRVARKQVRGLIRTAA